MNKRKKNMKAVAFLLTTVLLVMVFTINNRYVSAAATLDVTIKNPIQDSIIMENESLTVTADVTNNTNITKVVFYEFAKPGYQSKTIGEDNSYPYSISYKPSYYYNECGYSSNHIAAIATTKDNQQVISDYRRFYVFSANTVKPSPTISIANWKNNKTSAYTPTYDDGYLIESHKVINKLHKNNIVTNQQRDIKGTIFTNTNETNWDELSKSILPDNTLGMGVHTMSHCDGFQTPLSVMDAELRGAQATMYERIGKLPLTHAYPFYKVNDDIINLTKKYYISARWGSDAGNALNGSINNINDPAVGINAYNTTDYYKIKAMCPDTYTPTSTFNKWLDDSISKKGWLVTSMHGIKSKHQGSWKCQDDAELNEHFDYTQAKIKEGSVWNDTFENVSLYLRERNSAVLKDTSIDNVLQFKYDLTVNNNELSENLKQYLNYPLTLTIKLPKDWYGVKVVQGSNTISAGLTQINGEIYGMFDIVPGKGEFVVSRINN